MAAFTVEIDHGSGYTDYSDIALKPTIQRKKLLWNKLTPAINSVTLKLTYNATLYNALLSATGEVSIRIKKDSVDYFIGIIRKNFDISVRTRVDPIKITAVDRGELLKRDIDSNLAYVGKDVVDIGDTTNSIVHLLLRDHGDFDDNTFVNITSSVAKTIDYYVVLQTEKKKYWNEIQRLLYEFGYTFNFNDSGKFDIYQFAKATVTAGDTIDNDDMIGQIKTKKVPESFEAASVTYQTHETLGDTVVFNDTTGGDQQNIMSVSLDDGDFYPDGGDTTTPVYAVYKVTDREVVAVTGATADYDPTSIDEIRFNDHTKSADWLIQNNSGSTKTLEKFQITGTAIVKGDIYIRKVEKVASTKKIKEETLRWVTTDADADVFANALADYYYTQDLRYSFQVKNTTLDVGDIVTLDEDVLGVSTDVVLVASQENISGADGSNPTILTDFIAEGIEDLSTLTPEAYGQRLTTLTVGYGTPAQPSQISPSVFPDAPSDENLAGYWPLNGSVVDASGNGLDGILTPGIGDYEVAQAGKGFHFDGTNSRVQLNNLSQLTTDPFSFSAWVYLDTLSPGESNPRIIDFGTTSIYIVLFYSIPNERYQVSVIDSGSITNNTGLNTAIAQTWQHVAVTFDGTNLKIYLDGVFIGNNTGTALTGTTLTSGAIGSDRDTPGAQTMDGIIDEVRYYNTVLTDTEVLYLFKNPAGTQPTAIVPVAPSDENLVGYWPFNNSAIDASGYGNDGALEGTNPGYTPGVVGQGFLSPGVDERIDVGANAPLDDLGNGDFSISLWMKSADDTPIELGRLFQKYQNTSNRFYAASTNAGDTTRAHFLFVKSGTTVSAPFDSVAFDGNLHHLVFVIDRSSDVVKLYMDGTKDAVEIDISSLPTDSSNTGNLSFGARSEGTRPYEGMIDEPRIYDKALNQEEVSYLYSNASGTQPTPIVPGAPSDENLVAYYPLNGSTVDASGNGLNGILTTGTGRYETAQAGKGYHFDGVSEQIQLPDSLGTFTQGSFCAWINADTLAPTDNPALIMDLKLTGGSENIRLLFDSGATDTVFFRIRESGANSDASSNNAIVAGNWYFVVGTYDGEIVRIYMNGVLQSDTEILSSASVTPDQNAIGSEGSTSTLNNFDGTIDEVRIYSVALTQSEIDYLYNNPSGVQPTAIVPVAPSDEDLVGYYPLNGSVVDASGQGHDGTLTTGTGGYVDGKAGKAFDFDGLASVITITDTVALQFGTGDFSVAMWIEFDNDTISSNENFFEKRNSSSFEGITMQRNAADEKIYFVTPNVIGVSGHTIESNVPATNDGMHHYTFIRRSGIMYMYIDAIQQTDTEASSTSVSDDTYDITIGARYDSTLFIDGKMDEVRIYNIGLSQSEITYLYNNPAGTQPTAIVPVAPNDEDLVAYYPLNASTVDASGSGNDGVFTPGIGGYEDGKAGKSYHFDGIVENIIVQDSPSFSFGSGDFSISLFLYSDNTPGGTENVIAKRSGTGSGFLCRLAVAETIEFAVDTGSSVVVTSNTGTYKSGQWLHVVCVRENDICKLYVDAVLQDDTETLAGSIDNTIDLHMGSTAVPDSYFDGKLDEVRFYSSALSQAEINYLHQNPAGTQPTAIVPVAPSDEDLISYWPLNSSEIDYSGKGHNGTLIPGGTRGYTDGISGSAYDFDGTNDNYISVDDHSDFAFGTTDSFSVSIWFSTTDTGNPTFLYTKSEGAWNNQGFAFRKTGADSFKAEINDAGPTHNASVFMTLPYLNDGLFHHAAVIVDRDAEQMHLYIDGILRDSDNTALVGSITSTDVLHLGSNDSGGQTFNGPLDEIRFYSVALTPAEVLYLYNNPQGPQSATVIPVAPSDENLIGYWPLNGSTQDFSGNGNIGTLTPGIGGYETAISGKGFHFDGIESVVYVPFAEAVTTFSISAWIYIDTLSPADSFNRIFHFTDSGATGSHRCYLDSTGTNKIYIIFDDNVASQVLVSTNEAVQASRWYHVVFVDDGVNGSLYLDGTFQNRIDVSALGSVTMRSLAIGANEDGSNQVWDGLIDEFRFYDSALTQAEVLYLYDNPQGPQSTQIVAVAPDDEFLQAYYPLNAGTQDYSGKGRHGTLVPGTGGYETAKSGFGYHFDGVDEHVLLTDSFGTFTNVSLCAWVKVDTLAPADANNRVIELRQSSDNDRVFLQFNSSGGDTLLFSCYDATIAYNAGSNAAIEADVWYFVVGTYDGENVRLYLNGVLQDDVEALSGATWTPDENVIGSAGDVVTSNNWDGVIDEVRVYNRALLQEEIKYLFDNPQGPQATYTVPIDPGSENLVAHYPLDSVAGTYVTDKSGNSNHGTLTAGTGDWEDGYVYNAYHFDGAAEYITVPDDDTLDFGSGDFAFSVWLYSDNGPSADEYFMMKRSGSGNGIQALLDQSEDKILFSVDTGSVFHMWSDAGVFQSGVWLHVVCVRESTIMKMYVNGILQSETLAAAGDVDNTVGLYLGSTSTPGSYFDGKLDEARFYSKALSPEEVLYLFQNPGGTPKGLAGKDDVDVGVLDSSHLILGGDNSLITNTEEFTEDMGELFPLDLDALSDFGTVAEQKLVNYQPARLVDSDGIEYNNPKAKQWDGLANDPYTSVIGVWEETTNEVEDPEDLTTTNWTGSSSTAVLTDQYFDNKRWTKVPNNSGSSGYQYQVIDTSGFTTTTPSISFLCQQGSGTGDRALVLFSRETGGVLVKARAYVNWATQTVEGIAGGAITGTLVDAYFISSTICYVSMISDSITPSDVHWIRCYGSDDAVASEYNYYTAVQVEDKVYPTPYTPTDRQDGTLQYRKKLEVSGAIECYVRARFIYNTTTTHTVWSWYKDATHYFRLFYEPAADEFNVAYMWGTTEQILTQGINYSNATLWTWIHIKVVWDYVALVGKLMIDGVSKDSSWSGLPDTYDDSGYNFYIGEDGDGTSHFDGEVTQLAVHITEDATIAHYTADAPWKGQYSMANYDQSLVLSRKFLKMTRGELAIIDKRNREIALGSQGILARDAAGNIIHDIPDAAMLIGMKYIGHPLVFEEVAAIDSLETTFTDTASNNTAYGATTNSDITSYIPAGLTNIKGAVITADIEVYFVSGKWGYAEETYCTASLEFSTQYNTASFYRTFRDLFSLVPGRVGDNWRIKSTFVAIVPVFEIAGSYYITWRHHHDFQRMKSANVEYKLTTYLDLVGLYT